MAAPRAEVPPDIEARVYGQVRREWEVATSRPDGADAYRRVRRTWILNVAGARLRRWMMPVALAASLLLAIGVLQQREDAPVPMRVPVATVARVIVAGNPDGLPLSGDPVYADERLSTGPGQGLSLRLGNATSLRVDQNTTLVVDAAHRLSLESGRVYADTGAFIYRDRALVIDTGMGSVTDIGTQFAVEIQDGMLQVAVREGRVDVNRDAGEVVALAGERLRLERDGAVIAEKLAPHDAYWDWAAGLAPPFNIQNKSLLDFLSWAARETGRELVFHDNELRMAAMRTDLHGSVAGLGPAEALDAVLATTGFRYRTEADRIVIEP